MDSQDPWSSSYGAVTKYMKNSENSRKRKNSFSNNHKSQLNDDYNIYDFDGDNEEDYNCLENEVFSRRDEIDEEILDNKFAQKLLAALQKNDDERSQNSSFEDPEDYGLPVSKEASFFQSQPINQAVNPWMDDGEEEDYNFEDFPEYEENDEELTATAVDMEISDQEEDNVKIPCHNSRWDQKSLDLSNTKTKSDKSEIYDPFSVVGGYGPKKPSCEGKSYMDQNVGSNISIWGQKPLDSSNIKTVSDKSDIYDPSCIVGNATQNWQNYKPPAEVKSRWDEKYLPSNNYVDPRRNFQGTPDWSANPQQNLNLIQHVYNSPQGGQTTSLLNPSNNYIDPRGNFQGTPIVVPNPQQNYYLTQQITNTPQGSQIMSKNANPSNNYMDPGRNFQGTPIVPNPQQNYNLNQQITNTPQGSQTTSKIANLTNNFIDPRTAIVVPNPQQNYYLNQQTTNTPQNYNLYQQITNTPQGSQTTPKTVIELKKDQIYQRMLANRRKDAATLPNVPAAQKVELAKKAAMQINLRLGNTAAGVNTNLLKRALNHFNAYMRTAGGNNLGRGSYGYYVNYVQQVYQYTQKYSKLIAHKAVLDQIVQQVYRVLLSGKMDLRALLVGLDPAFRKMLFDSCPALGILSGQSTGSSGGAVICTPRKDTQNKRRDDNPLLTPVTLTQSVPPQTVAVKHSTTLAESSQGAQAAIPPIISPIIEKKPVCTPKQLIPLPTPWFLNLMVKPKDLVQIPEKPLINPDVCAKLTNKYKAVKIVDTRNFDRTFEVADVIAIEEKLTEALDEALLNPEEAIPKFFAMTYVDKFIWLSGEHEIKPWLKKVLEKWSLTVLFYPEATLVKRYYFFLPPRARHLLVDKKTKLGAIWSELAGNNPFVVEDGWMVSLYVNKSLHPDLVAVECHLGSKSAVEGLESRNCWVKFCDDFVKLYPGLVPMGAEEFAKKHPDVHMLKK